MSIKDTEFVKIVKKYILIAVVNDENKKKLENMVHELYDYHNFKLEQVSEESRKDDILDIVLSDEDGEQFWIKDPGNLGIAYKYLVEYFLECGMDWLEIPNINDGEERMLSVDEDEGEFEFRTDEENGELYYYWKI